MNHSPSPAMPLDIGFIGLGVMGAPMAGHLARAGHRLTVLDADNLQALGVLKNKAASWKDYFFEEAHGGDGS